MEFLQLPYLKTIQLKTIVYYLAREEGKRPIMYISSSLGEVQGGGQQQPLNLELSFSGPTSDLFYETLWGWDSVIYVS